MNSYMSNEAYLDAESKNVAARGLRLILLRYRISAAAEWAS